MSSIPDPKAGMVVQYEYLWARQYNKGWTTGEKQRPCAILAVIEGNDETTVYVSPITHTAPYHPEQSVLLSQATSQRLGLDAHDKWLMINEVNRFVWPGLDLRRVPHQSPSTCVYGMLPEAVLVEAKTKLKEFNENKDLKFVPRDLGTMRMERR